MQATHALTQVSSCQAASCCHMHVSQLRLASTCTSHANCVSYVCMYVFVPAAQQLHVTCTPQLPSSSMYVCMYVSMHTPAAQQLSWYMHYMHTPAAKQLHACFDVHSSCPAAPILHDTSAAKTISCLHILVHVFQLPSSFLACHMEAFMPARAYNPAAM